MKEKPRPLDPKQIQQILTGEYKIAEGVGAPEAKITRSVKRLPKTPR